MFFAIICGGVFFEEFDSFVTVTWIGFAFGVAMILGGVYALAPENSCNVAGNVELIKAVVAQIDEVDEVFMSFRHHIFNTSRVHPVTEMLRATLEPVDSSKTNMSAAVRHFRKMSRKAKEEQWRDDDKMSDRSSVSAALLAEDETDLPVKPRVRLKSEAAAVELTRVSRKNSTQYTVRKERFRQGSTGEAPRKSSFLVVPDGEHSQDRDGNQELHGGREPLTHENSSELVEVSIAMEVESLKM
jgi:hypothetical protein